jgi:16S rRNA (cytosine967-C5)-methyltransferase
MVLLRLEERPLKPEDILAGAGGGAALDPSDRAFLRNLVYGVIRWRRLLDRHLDRHLERPRSVPPLLRQILRLGAFQILFTHVPPRAAVHTAVALARERGGEALASLTNAVLRKIPPGEAGRLEEPLDPAERHSFPDWLATRWQERFGAEEAVALMDASNLHPAPVLRLNDPRADRQEVIRRMGERGLACRPTLFSPLGIQTEGQGSLTDFLAGPGSPSVQDEAFQLVGLAAPREEGRVLDLFAGLGGKTTLLAGRLAGRGTVTAADRYPAKLAALEEEARRLGLGAIPAVAADAGSPPFAAGAFHGVLLDVPCSGTGVIRRHPDIKWNRRAEDIPRLASQAASFLASAARLVAPGGWLLYATCSLEDEENREVVEGFLARNADFRVERPALPEGAESLVTPEGHFQSLPHRHGLDGAFASLLRRG